MTRLCRARVAEPAEKAQKTGRYPIKTLVNATLFCGAARDVPQPSARPRLRDRHPEPRVHVGLPEDRAPGLRRDPDHLRPRRALYRVEGAEVLLPGVPQ